MSNAKYEKLTRTRELTAEDFQGFINRQLVITNQANKAVAEILKKLMETQLLFIAKLQTLLILEINLILQNVEKLIMFIMLTTPI